ncbi:MAG: hypothetical protein A2V66_16050 [Ignavibacteria bacterium RBG_13_36_8]|nr:MAG: hypothetical protein A2V66_16050 [Ignavibacteria bacterium RBG_13_36_8]
MERRQFLCKSGCAIAGLAAAPVLAGDFLYAQAQSGPRYEIEIEIYEAREDTWCHKRGDKFKWPEDMGKICPWLRSSMHDFVRLLQFGATLKWRYSGTPYEKVIDSEGITTEYVRCPDPTANLVAKITRTKVG